MTNLSKSISPAFLYSEVAGDASETAILKKMQTILDIDVMQVRSMFPKVCEIPFNSTNKFHVTIHENSQSGQDKSYVMCMKGAPERVLDRCKTYSTDMGDLPIDDQFKKEFNDAYNLLGGFGERVLGLSMLELNASDYPKGTTFDSENPNFPLEGFKFVGLVTMIDPPRPGVSRAVEKCRRAGIRVVMVTGDHPITAKAIAQSVRIISKSK